MPYEKKKSVLYVEQEYLKNRRFMDLNAVNAVSVSSM